MIFTMHYLITKKILENVNNKSVNYEHSNEETYTKKLNFIG